MQTSTEGNPWHQVLFCEYPREARDREFCDRYGPGYRSRVQNIVLMENITPKTILLKFELSLQT